MVYLIAALVACLAVIALGVRYARKRIAELNQEVVDALKDSKRAYHLVHDAARLLHDERHKGKLGNQEAWQKARGEWYAKSKGAAP